jgi:sarcosine oxidase/L-pipecolate oxidase
MPLTPDCKILIIGSGVFGLSTALWLARSGYRRVTVLDMQDTGAKGYDPGEGIESASADINKIVRFSYGDEIEYQRLAAQAAEIWEEWNDEIAEERGEGEKKLWYKCGFLRMAAGVELPDFEILTLTNMEREGIRNTQFRSDDDVGEFIVYDKAAPALFCEVRGCGSDSSEARRWNEVTAQYIY